MSIMINSAKTPSGKTSKGKVSIYVEKGRIKARLPRQYFGGEQPRIALGMDTSEANMARAQRLAERMTLDLQDGCFDETLAKYGIVADLKLKGSHVTSDDQVPPKPELSLMEVWDMYCEHIKPRLAITTYEAVYSGDYRRYLRSAINHVGEDSLQIRNWLIANRDAHNAKKILSLLAKAYALAIRQDLFSGKNPFEGLTEGIEGKKRVKEINQNDYNEDNEVENKDLAFTWDEAEAIMQFLKTSDNPRFNHWYHFVSFKFLTGCRQGEAIALWWCDINWQKEHILIRRSYSSRLKKFKPTKNETVRIFPMPKDGRLWNLLKELPEGNPNEVVFTNREGTTIHHCSFGDVWKGTVSVRKNKTYNYPGICQTLIDRGKISKYLPPYNTRHTFITRQIYELERDKDVVNAWCEHGEKISAKHYRDTKQVATQINPELPAKQQVQQQSKIELLEKQMKQQQELIAKLQAQLNNQKQ